MTTPTTAWADPLTDAAPAASSSGPAAQADRPYRVDLVEDLASLEGMWRTMERCGVSSPYQRFDWVCAYVSALRDSEGFELRTIVVRDPDGRALLILPLAIRRGHAGRVASIVGGKQANFHLPLMAPGAAERLDVSALRLALIEAGRRLGIDAYALTNLPLQWRGERNPLADGGRPSPSNGFRLTLDRDPEATLARAFSKDTRKKLRKKEKALAELGPVSHRVARTPDEADVILAAFLAQKRARFRELGIANPFDDAATQDFLRRACTGGLERSAPAIELHALAAGDRIVAVFGAAVDAWRCCGMFISFDPEASRSSPGDLLLTHAVRTQCEAGRETFDLGVGEARYKSSLCEEIEDLVDVVVPVTWRGRAYAAGSKGILEAKRRIKQTSWTWTLVGMARRLKARVEA